MPFDNPSEPRPTRPEIQILETACHTLSSPVQWCQRRYTVQRPLKSGGVIWQRCLVSSIDHAFQLTQYRKDREIIRAVYEAVAAEVTLPTRSRFGFTLVKTLWPRWRSNRHKVVWFNDLRTTRYEHVIGLLRRTIERLESAGSVDAEQRLIAYGVGSGRNL